MHDRLTAIHDLMEDEIELWTVFVPDNEEDRLLVENSPLGEFTISIEYEDELVCDLYPNESFTRPEFLHGKLKADAREEIKNSR